MGREAQVWVHPNLRYMGGTYDRYTGRAFFGGPWPARVERSIHEFDGDSIAITTLKEDDSSVVDLDVNGPRSDIPYARRMWDDIVEDADYGDLRDDHLETLERWSREYDHITVRGGALNDCLRMFVETYREVDPDTPITVDPGNAYLAREGFHLPLRDAGSFNWEKNRAKTADRASDNPTRVQEIRAYLEELDNVTVTPTGSETAASGPHPQEA